MKTKSSAITIGLDLGDRKHAVCVLDAKGEILKQESITNTSLRNRVCKEKKRSPRRVVVKLCLDSRAAEDALLSFESKESEGLGGFCPNSRGPSQKPDLGRMPRRAGGIRKSPPFTRAKGGLGGKP